MIHFLVDFIAVLILDTQHFNVWFCMTKTKQIFGRNEFTISTYHHVTTSTEAFAWTRTTGAMQDGTSGPLMNHDGSTASESPAILV